MQILVISICDLMVDFEALEKNFKKGADELGDTNVS